MMRPALDSNIYLASCLAPLAAHLARTDVTDVYINKPGEIWIESANEIRRIEMPELTAELLLRMARQLAATSAQAISREHPLLGATLPGGERAQIVIAPAVRGEIAIAIRKHVVSKISLDEYLVRDGADLRTDQAEAVIGGVQATGSRDNLAGFLRSAVRQRRNILISGGTSSGKTTLLNSLLSEVPDDERLITIEDSPELKLRHANWVGLIAARGETGEARVSMDDLLIASLRMRPDRIVLGEIRGGEAVTYLRAINTGHPGSMTTIHADSPLRAIDQLAFLVLQTGLRMSWENVVKYIRTSIDIVIQVRRSSSRREIEMLTLEH